MMAITTSSSISVNAGRGRDAGYETGAFHRLEGGGNSGAVPTHVVDEVGLWHGAVTVEVEQHDLVRRGDSGLVQQFRAHPCVSANDLQQQRPDRCALDAGADVPGPAGASAVLR